MAFFLLRRLALLVLAMFVASIVIFLLLRLLPGDLAQVLGGTDASPSQITELRRQLGLNRPLASQYGSWIWKAMRGDFGTSPLNGTGGAGQLGDKLRISGPLILGSTVLSVLVAVPLGIVAAARHRKADGVTLSV